MALPSADDTSSTVIRSARFSVSRTKANTKTKGHAKGVGDALAHLLSAVARRNDADDATLEADALHDFTLETLEDALGRFQARVIGFEEVKNGPHLKRIFQKPLSTLVVTPKSQQAEVFGGILKRAEAAESPAEIKKAVKEYGLAVKDLLGSHKAVESAQALFAEAQKKEQTAKKAVVVAMIRIQGQLLDLFAEDRTRVARFFLKGAKPAKPAVKKGGTPAPTPPTP